MVFFYFFNALANFFEAFYQKNPCVIAFDTLQVVTTRLEQHNI
jgi:hypothetical protein